MKWILELNDSFENKETPVVVYQQMDNGAETPRRHMSIADVVTAFSKPVDIINEENLIDDFNNEVRIPILPPNTIGYSSSQGKMMKERVTMTIPKGIWPIQYAKGPVVSTHLIGMPKMVVQYVVLSIPNTRDRRIIETKLFAVKDERTTINEETQLFYFPFPNVNKSSGVVCWGANHDMSVPQLTDLELVFGKFISAPFNEDYGCYIGNGEQCFEKYIKNNENQPFDDDLLLPITNTKIGNLYGEQSLHGLR